ncbi:MAG: signal recognition particle-docking protein FtsY [Treponema sp. CETP13]|nr:MAG: signal recognition particle-docking protein FtsY [Treponema sp. CETP13]
MAKTGFKQKIKKIFTGHRTLDSEYFEDLADILVEGDIGAKASFKIVEDLENICSKQKIKTEEGVKKELFAMLQSQVKSISLVPKKGQTNIYLVLGVNGAGKTTSVGKMAKWYNDHDVTPVVMAAADTYRAAAINQLKVHAEKTGVRVVAQQDGSDPSAVVFDAAEAVTAAGGGLVLADTAGRLHNKENLVHELEKIDRIAASKASEGCYKKILVLDATTGQNALRQAEVFHDAVGVDAVILTKYDSTAKGGVAYSLGKELAIPIAFVCFGEKYEDIALFDADRYLKDFLGE